MHVNKSWMFNEMMRTVANAMRFKNVRSWGLPKYLADIIPEIGKDKSRNGSIRCAIDAQ